MTAQKYTKYLQSVYGLEVPEHPDADWLKAKRLQLVYECHVCHRKVNIHDVLLDDEGNVVCPVCQRRRDSSSKR